RFIAACECCWLFPSSEAIRLDHTAATEHLSSGTECWPHRDAVCRSRYQQNPALPYSFQPLQPGFPSCAGSRRGNKNTALDSFLLGLSLAPREHPRFFQPDGAHFLLHPACPAGSGLQPTRKPLKLT